MNEPKRVLRGFYGIADLPADAGTDAARALGERLADAGACIVQLRQKAADAGLMLENARALATILDPRGIPLCVNDRLDVALAAGALACHLGQQDLPLAAARRIAAGRLWLGVSTHSRAQAELAISGGADYLGFGPVYATTGKADPDPVVGLCALAEVCALARVPVVAIGGITVARVPETVAAGASAAAAIGAVLGAEDPVAAGRAIRDAFGRGRQAEKSV